jgi:hypothetical protein
VFVAFWEYLYFFRIFGGGATRGLVGLGIDWFAFVKQASVAIKAHEDG